jgi:ribonuclease HI
MMTYLTTSVFSLTMMQNVQTQVTEHPLVEEHMEKTTVHTAGSCLDDGYDNAQAGGGVWFGPDDPRNAALKIPGLNQSKQIGQLAAVLYAVQKTPPFAPLHIISTSRYIIDCFFKKFTNWEENGWITIPNKEFIRPIVSHLRARGAITTFARATDPTELKNANMLAQQGLYKMLHDILDLTPVQKFNLTGAQLSTMSQAMAYKGIQERLCPNPRSSTVINLDITRYAVKRITKHLPTDASIWLSVRNKDITRTIKVFL